MCLCVCYCIPNLLLRTGLLYLFNSASARKSLSWFSAQYNNTSELSVHDCIIGFSLAPFLWFMSTLIAVVVGLYTYPGCLKQQHWLTWKRDLLLVSYIHQLLIGLKSSPLLQLQRNEMQHQQTASFWQPVEPRNGHPCWYLWNWILCFDWLTGFIVQT